MRVPAWLLILRRFSPRPALLSRPDVTRRIQCAPLTAWSCVASTWSVVEICVCGTQITKTDIKGTNRQQNQADGRGKSALRIHTTAGVNNFFNCARLTAWWECESMRNLSICPPKTLFKTTRLISGVNNKTFFFWFGLKVLFSGWSCVRLASLLSLQLLLHLRAGAVYHALFYKMIAWCFLYALYMLSKYPPWTWKSIA